MLVGGVVWSVCVFQIKAKKKTYRSGAFMMGVETPRAQLAGAGALFWQEGWASDE